MPGDLPISAIICTHNREHYLGAAIDSLLAQDFPDFEVIVVDNASQDGTRAVVEARQPHPRLHYCYEPVTGLSVARNTGARQARGQVLAYLDDDAEASPGWLRALWAGFEANDKLAIAGGKVTLLWPPGVSGPPPWLSPGLAGNLGAYDLGEQDCLITNPNLTPRGLNYALRREFWQQIGGFDPNLGRVGKNLLSNEELLVTELALKQGWQVAYLPAALAAHNVAPERLVKGWFLRRGWWQGVSECYREQLSGRAGWRQFGRGGERILRGLYKSLKNIRDPATRFENLVYAYGQIGYLKAALIAIAAPPRLHS